MADPSRRRRQDEPPIHPSSNPRYHQQPLHDPYQQRRSYAGTPLGRHRAGAANTPPTTAARGMGGSAGYSGYYPEPTAGFQQSGGMQQGTIGYHQPAADYGQDARQTQNFAGAYNPTAMMYNAQQPGGQNPVYDTTQQFPSRQPAAMQMMATDVAAPYFQSEPTSAAAASALQPHNASANASPAVVYQQSPADRSAMLQGYPSSSMGGMPPPPPQTAGSAPDASMEEQQEYPQPSGLDEAYNSYQSTLKEIFQNIQNGVLAAASESLLNVSDWLLSHVAELGLTSDDLNLHNDRIRLWNDFNYAWLAIFQKQKDLMESGQQQLSRSQSLITRAGLEKMGKELIRLCDDIERHGLVDYQYGVWEEQIIAILTDCVDLYEPENETGATGSSS